MKKPDDYIDVVNTTDEWIPAGAFVVPVGPADDDMIDQGLSNYVRVCKPFIDNDPRVYTVSEISIPPTYTDDTDVIRYGTGQARFAAQCFVTIDPAGTVPSDGDDEPIRPIGAKADSWYASYDRTGFYAVTQGQGLNGQITAVRAGSESEWCFITSVAKVGRFYPAAVQKKDPQTGFWTSTQAVWFEERRNGTVQLNDRILCRFEGFVNDKPLYVGTADIFPITQITGSGSGASGSGSGSGPPIPQGAVCWDYLWDVIITVICNDDGTITTTEILIYRRTCIWIEADGLHISTVTL